VGKFHKLRPLPQPLSCKERGEYSSPFPPFQRGVRGIGRGFGG